MRDVSLFQVIYRLTEVTDFMSKLAVGVMNGASHCCDCCHSHCLIHRVKCQFTHTVSHLGQPVLFLWIEFHEYKLLLPLLTLLTVYLVVGVLMWLRRHHTSDAKKRIRGLEQSNVAILARPGGVIVVQDSTLCMLSDRHG